MGFGCTTCIGNSGPLPEPVAQAVQKENLVVAAVLSGNRNFEGRINPLVKANYLASPPLVVAYALAGHHGYRPGQRSAGHRTPTASRSTCATSGPPTKKCTSTVRASIDHGDVPARIRAGVRRRRQLARPCPCPPATSTSGTTHSTYIKKPPYFDAHGGPGHVGRRISPACACWRCWAIR